jgi:vitamin B12 transporter
MKTHVLRSISLGFTLLACSFSSLAQSSSPAAQLFGVLSDPSGYPLNGVHVIARPDSSGSDQVWSVTTTPDGAYSLRLPPGSYHVSFARDSFVPRDFTVDVAPAENRRLDIRMEIQQLSENVIVTANAEPVEADQTPAPTDVITRREIDQRQTVLLPDLLATQPGVSIARTGRIGGLTTVFLDGGNSSFTKLLIDGTPVNYAGGDFDYSNLSLDNVEKVEIVHGAESALYGTDAMAGVIQIFSHRGSTRIPSARVFAEGGTYSSARGGAQVDGLIHNFDYSAAGSYFHTDGQGLNDADLNRAFSGNFGYSFSDSNQLRFSVRSNSSFAGTPGQTLLFPPGDPSAFYDLQNLSANVTWKFQTGAHWDHHLSGMEARSVSVSGFPPFGNFTNQFNRAGFLEQSTYFFRQGAATAGYQYEVENAGSFTLGGAHARRNNQGGFIDLRWSPISRITAVAGARADANTSFGTRVVPRAGVILAVRHGQGFWADTRARIFYGQGIEEPTAFESFSTDPCSPGNPNLRPQRSRTFNAGFDQFLDGDRFRVSATFFTNRFRDLIIPTPDIPNPACFFTTIKYLNTDLSRARGVNFSSTARLTRWLSLNANYSFDDTRILESPNASNGFQEPGDHLLRRPVNSGNIWLNATLRRLNFNFAGYFSGVRTDSDFDGLGINRNPGYARFDVATSYLVSHGLSFYARVTNLFDKQYQEAVGFPALGRDVRVGMNYRVSGKN